ncbi:MAG TPA: HEAT repeat domain-containing protein [Kofleriaceae bacterium]|nr:HEAT repeat domain-containing protein [Kofleriaceae bacterium]
MSSIHPPSLTITFEAALRDLASKDPRVRAAAAHALGDVTDAELRGRAVDGLLGVIGDARPEVRAEAAFSLGELETEAAVAPLVERLRDPDMRVRQAAAIGLGTLGFRAGFEPLRQALVDGPPDLRFQAATSLAEIDPEAAYEPLLAALGDGDGEVVGAAALALGALGDLRATGHLAGRLDHGRARTRFDVAFALAELGDGRGAAVLRAALDDEGLAWDAIESLERIGDPAAADALQPLAARRYLLKPLHVRAAGALVRLAPDHPGAAAARRLLTLALTHRRLELAGVAVDMLGRLGTDWAREALGAARATRRGRRLADEIDGALAPREPPP